MTSLRMKKILAAGALILAFSTVVPAARLVAQETASEKQSARESREAVKEAEGEDSNDAFLHSPAVKAFGAKLGMNAEQAATAFTIANFVVLAGVVGWFMAKGLPKTFRSRNDAIKKYLVEAEAASKDANARLSGVEARLSKLDEQISSMKAQAEKDLALEEQRIKAAVEEEKKHILATAEQEIAAATGNARREIQKYAAELAIDQAARKLVVTAETDRLLVQDFARKLVGDGIKGGQN